MRNVRLFIIAGAALAVGLGGFALRQRMHRASDGVSGAGAAEDSGASHLVVRLPAGASYRYRVGWKSDTTSNVPGLANGSMRGRVDVAADLVMRSLGESQGSYVVATSLERFGAHQLQVLGANVLPDDAAVDAAFKGNEAYVLIDPHGHIGGVYFKKEAPSLFKSFMPSLLAEVGVSLPDDSRSEWYAPEATPTGPSRTHYELTPATPGTVLARTRAEYTSVYASPLCDGCSQTLRSKGDVTIDPAGYLRGVHDDEEISLTRPTGEVAYHGTTTFVLTGPELGTFQAGTDVSLDMSALEAHALGAPVEHRTASRAMLEQQARGMTAAALENDISLAGFFGALPTDSSWPSRAAAVLQLHPESCSKLAEMFSQPKFTNAGRELLLDALASAGTSEAQAAMRKALVSPAATKDAQEYPQLLQRLSLVQAPDRDNAEILVDAYESAKKARALDAEKASALTLGATVKGLGREGKGDDARDFNTRLVDDLKLAKTSEDKKMLLGALGNAAREDDTKAIQAFASDDSADVRAEVAVALRDSDSTEARATVVGLAGDDDPGVQQAAIRSLGQMPVTAADLQTLAGKVSSIPGDTGAANALASMLASHLDDGDAVKTMLQALLARTENRMEQARIRGMLDRLAGIPAQ